VAQAENMLGRRCGYVGTLGFGLPAALETHALTTPDCLALHREIASLASDAVALEVSSHALLQDRIAGLRINTAIFTNLTRDHLDLHGSMESYAAVKAGLFRRPGLKSAILNLDDPFVATLLPQLDGGIRPIGISRTRQQAAGLRGQILQHGPEGMQLAVSGDYGEAAMSSTAIGEFNADNLLLALGALIAMEHDLASASAALNVCTVPPGRMEVVGQHDGAHLIVDYAHTPDALARALDTLSAFAPGRLICVFGCGGERDRGKRALMGRVAAERADRIILTDDNPRREDPVQIVQDIAAGMTGFGQLKIEHDRIAAVRAAIDEAGPGDLVLIAGRGHETVQHTAAGQRPLSDRDIVLTALGGSS
jgi:UDP-N-acetylmuramoyl-L-alanyl-D-glutamate--2,6-diaminopimelate ligase